MYFDTCNSSYYCILILNCISNLRFLEVIPQNEYQMNKYQNIMLTNFLEFKDEVEILYSQIC